MGGEKLINGATKGNIQEVQARIAEGEGINEIDKWGWSALHWSVYKQKDVMTEWLLKHGADPNLKATTINHLLPKGITPLGIAAYYGLENGVALLMAAKADPLVEDDEDGFTPMDYVRTYQWVQCHPLMRVKDAPIVPEEGRKLKDVLVVLESGVAEAQKHLGLVKGELEAELGRRKIRCLVYIVDSLDLESEKDYAAKRDAFRPSMILDCREI
jgi:hypothetical protein